MIALLALFLAAAPEHRLLVFEEPIRVPRTRSRAVPIAVRQRPARVECRFKTQDPKQAIRAVLMKSAEVQRFREGRVHRTLAETAVANEGWLSSYLTRPDEYMVILDNRTESRAVLVDVKVELVFDEWTSFEPRRAAPARRATALALSVAFFCVVGGWAGWRIRKAVRNRT